MELSKPQEIGNLKFSEPTSINIGDMKKITIRREDGKPLVIPTGKCFLRGEKRHEVQVRVNVPRSRQHTIGAFESIISQCEKTPWKTTIKVFIPPRRRDHHDLRQTQNGQGRNPLEVLQGQGGDRPHDLRGEALRGEGGARDRRYNSQR